jgi:transposase
MDGMAIVVDNQRRIFAKAFSDSHPLIHDTKLRKLGGDGMTLRFCYEAGPCGYDIHRRLSARGHECTVVAPSLIPKRAGDRVKTDRCADGIRSGGL